MEIYIIQVGQEGYQVKLKNPGNTKKTRKDRTYCECDPSSMSIDAVIMCYHLFDEGCSMRV